MLGHKRKAWRPSRCILVWFYQLALRALASRSCDTVQDTDQQSYKRYVWSTLTPEGWWCWSTCSSNTLVHSTVCWCVLAHVDISGFSCAVVVSWILLISHQSFYKLKTDWFSLAFSWILWFALHILVFVLYCLHCLCCLVFICFFFLQKLFVISVLRYRQHQLHSKKFWPIVRIGNLNICVGFPEVDGQIHGTHRMRLCFLWPPPTHPFDIFSTSTIGVKQHEMHWAPSCSLEEQFVSVAHKIWYNLIGTLLFNFLSTLMLPRRINHFVVMTHWFSNNYWQGFTADLAVFSFLGIGWCKVYCSILGLP